MSPFKRLISLAAGLSLALAALTVTPAAYADTGTDVDLTLETGGPVNATLSDATLAEITYSHSSQTPQGSVKLRVDDPSGTGAGWHVTIQASTFLLDDVANPLTDIPASNLSLTTVNTPTDVAGQARHETHGPLAITPAPATLGAARTVISADADYGQGTYDQILELQLAVPGQARAGTYTSTLTVTSIPGPEL